MKVLFALDTLACGGIEKSALAQIDSLAEENEITVLLDERKGDLLPLVNSKARIRTISYGEEALREKHLGRKKYLLWLILRLRILTVVKLLLVYYKERGLSREERAIVTRRRLYLSQVSPDTDRYDVAICYAELVPLCYVVECVSADKKVLWMHTELSDEWCNVNYYEPYISKMDEIIAVSERLAGQLKQRFPHLAERIECRKHKVNRNMIERLADENFESPWGEGSIGILTVGRLSPEKGVHLAIEAALLLKNQGLNFSWCFVGDGSERMKLECKVKELHLEDCVTFVGTKINPYPYMKTCDVYVQPSLYEGFGLTIAEALCLGKVIVSTHTIGGDEQLRDNATSRLVPISAVGIAGGIMEVANATNKN